jgi:hypothetical protein
MKIRERFVLAGVVAISISAVAFGMGEKAAPDQLQPFERLIGGQWVFESGDAYHVFEWGLARRSVRSRSYFVTPEGDKLVSEGTWFWHPGEQAIKGYATAIEMGIDVFEYTTRFEGDVAIHDLRAWGLMAGDSPLLETWTFTDSDHYRWELSEDPGDGFRPSMAGDYERRR